MTEITVRFDLTFSRRFIKTAGALVMMLCAVPELDSESVTLSTYYPAPSGVYTNMITTGNTFLARDGGAGTSVGIGTTAPGAKLDVNGLARMQRLTTTGANALNVADPYAADLTLGSDAGVRHDSTIMMWSAASAMRLRSASDVLYLNTWNSPAATYNVALAAGVGQTSTFNGPVTATGKISGGDTFVSTGYNCNQVVYGLGYQGCGVGRYATYTSGVMVKYTMTVGTTDPTGTMLCCVCPAGGCPNL
jgi:hypothetical protein